jgi:hypothetical protein
MVSGRTRRLTQINAGGFLGSPAASIVAIAQKKEVILMDEDRDDPMPQGPTNNLFLAVAGFGFVAAFVAVGLIVAASLGLLR